MRSRMILGVDELRLGTNRSAKMLGGYDAVAGCSGSALNDERLFRRLNWQLPLKSSRGWPDGRLVCLATRLDC